MIEIIGMCLKSLEWITTQPTLAIYVKMTKPNKSTDNVAVSY